MKILDTARKTAQKAAAAVVDAIAPPSRRARDPWYSNEGFVARVNGRRSGAWLGSRRKGWLR